MINEKIVVDAGFYSFNFRNTGETVQTGFYWFSPTATTFYVNDCYCVGDAFEIYDNSVFQGETSTGGYIGTNSCERYSDQALECYLDTATWSSWIIST